MFKYTFKYLFAFILTTTVYAQKNIPSGTPVSNEKFTVILDNGERFDLKPYGDSELHWYETKESYPVIYINSKYYFGKIENSAFVASNIKLSNKNIDLYKNQIEQYQQHFLEYLSARSKTKSLKSFGGVPTIGKIRIPVLLVEFSDRLHSISKENVEDMFMQNNHDNYGSLRDYYLRASHNQLDIQFDVYGWYQSNLKLSEVSEKLGSEKAGKVVRKAVQLAYADGVDFSVYDNDNDGDVDAVIVMHAGLGADHYGQEQYIWPRSWSLESTVGKAQIYNSIKVNDYVIACEMREFSNKWSQAGIGTFAHEFGHALGLPDLYDSTGKSNGLGHWAVMSAGSWLSSGYKPGNFCAWSRIKLGWDEPKKISYDYYGDYNLADSHIQNELYQISSVSDNEYFLLENRKQTENDIDQPGEGLAIYHINRTKANQNYGVNDNRDNPGIRLVEADFNKKHGLYNAEDRGVEKDLFSYNGNEQDFSPYTVPNSNLFDGNTSKLWLRNITKNNGTISFSLDQVTGIETVSNSSDINCYPNPFINTITLKQNSGNFENTRLNIYNLKGSIVYKEQIQNIENKHQINLQFLPTGVYILKVITSNKSFVEKIVKTN